MTKRDNPSLSCKPPVNVHRVRDLYGRGVKLHGFVRDDAACARGWYFHGHRICIAIVTGATIPDLPYTSEFHARRPRERIGTASSLVHSLRVSQGDGSGDSQPLDS